MAPPTPPPEPSPSSPDPRGAQARPRRIPPASSPASFSDPSPLAPAHPLATLGLLDASSIELALDALQTRIDQLQQNLAQQNKLATLGMVTAVLAHEFNNILTPMISYTRFALSDKGDEPLRTKALNKALTGAERLANISKSLLGFARGDESTAADVAAAVSETLACLSRDPAKDGITLTLEIQPGLRVAMNAGQLQQVLMNLVVNARSALLSPPAPATPDAPPRRAIKRLSITGKIIKRGKIAEIRIADTGPGIPPHVRDRMFDPFFSTKRPDSSTPLASPDPEDTVPRGGTGLGLTICQELITAAGGAIREEGSPGQGALFILELPLAPEPEIPADH
ncbi:MAG TPA: HAMP domain-containing sensor histidine kinase [Phycisphaerae bacterium]|nr:HAMP domain-containing sensor histidine kinase [Phycisphaerae bacterium]